MFSASKLNFANQLSLNSTVRKLLSRAALLWILAELLKLVTPFAATSLSGKSIMEDSGTVNCIVFRQYGTPLERNFPTINTAIGIGELIFGSSIGTLRSEVPGTTFTQAAIGPQLIGVVNNGDTIVGDGFTADILSTCWCVDSFTSQSLIDYGIDSSIAPAMIAQRSNIYSPIGMINAIQSDSQFINISTILTGTSLCNGYNISSVPLCTSTISNHQTATIQMTVYFVLKNSI